MPAWCLHDYSPANPAKDYIFKKSFSFIFAIILIIIEVTQSTFNLSGGRYLI